MPSSRRYAAPVIVEVKPDDVKASSSIAPSTPPQNKAVRFSTDAEIITGITRPLSPTEAWSLYHFETHARTCPTCHDPYQVVLHGNRLCDSGHALAYDVAMHVYHRGGQIYSTRREQARDIRVEVPHGYERLVALLKAMDRKERKPKRIVPIVSYDPPKVYPSTRRPAPAVQPMTDKDYTDAYIEPARSDRRPHRKSHHKSSRYSTIVLGDDNDDDNNTNTKVRLPQKDDKRGSLYEKDIQRPRKEYRVEVREPTDGKERRRRETVYYN